MKTTLLVLALLAAVAMAAVSGKGSAHVASGTSDFERNFRAPASNLTVYPSSADVQVLHFPHRADADTFVVRAGTSFTWDNTTIYGFKVIRTGATAVDAWWW
jgi:hypothetical protein